VLVDNKSHVPDILDCIANLSSDEVFTPPEVANQVLDLLPKEIWSDPNIKILDPCCKTGIFLRESARRLMVGLENAIPDEEERREHIFQKMLYGIAITELTGLVSRRSLYYSKDASSDYSIVQFKDKDGNITYKRTEHDYVQGKCRICGSPYENLERGDSMENYAYQFIHEEEVFKMKFDVIIGNPPYQIESGGYGAQATPIYQHFVEQAFRLKPRYVGMIIPSRWFAGGMGLDSFRERMLSSKNFRNLVDFANASDLFPGVEIKGGVSYFLWDKNYDGKCETVLVQNGEYGSKLERYLGEHGDTFIRFNEAIPILEKVINKKYKPLSNLVSGVNPFDLPTNFKDFVEKSDKSTVKLFMRGTTAFVNKNKIKKNLDLVSSWKVMVSQAYGAGDGYPHQIIGKPFVSKPNEACTMTYLVVGPCRNQIEANNLCLYLQTKFARFLIALKKNTQHLSKTKFDFVPNLDFSKTWSDEELVKEFRITKTEQNFIAQIVREIGSVDD
jgi:site-specific DNA-methyltransferase (adenine-specific)